MSPRIAVVLKGYPRLSETFIAQEIRALECRGFDLMIVSLRHPYDPATHPIHAEIEAPVLYLPEYVRDDRPRVWRALLKTCMRAGFWRALAALLRDLRRDPTYNRLRRFAQALVMAAELPSSIQLYYTHFMHTPASVSYYAARITGLRWSLSAHAKDIWTLPSWEISEKLASVDWAVTCTGVNHRYLCGLTDAADKVSLLYHGLDFSRFEAPAQVAAVRDGSDPADPVRLISVGRAVDKKGYDYLLEALAALPATLHWKLAHIGGGELLQQLGQQARSLGIDERIEWRGALPQTEVLEAYRDADLFVLPSKISEDGDRDGLPNVLMEAQSQGLACLSTNISGIPELIEHGETGWLVEQRDVAALTRALQTLVEEPDLRHRLGRAGNTRVREKFSMERGIDLLVERIQGSLAQPCPV